MSLTLSPVGRSLLANTTHHHVKLWRVERKDGTILTFTNSDRNISFVPPSLANPAAEIYTAADSFAASATAASAGLRARNKELKGIVSSSVITETDLRKGLYRDAKVTEFTVDSRFPMLGPIITEVFYIQSLEYAQDVWVADVAGVASFLENKIGDVATPRCPYALGDLECRKSLKVMTRFAVAVDTVTDRQTFTATAGSLPDATAGADVTGTVTSANAAGTTLTDSTATFITDGIQIGQLVKNATDGSEALVTEVTSENVIAHSKLEGGAEDDWDSSDEYELIKDPDLDDGYFALGKLIWNAGTGNHGVPAQVAKYQHDTRTFTLRIPMPVDIQVGDTFDAEPGCDKTLPTCATVFHNKKNYGADEFVPGVTDVLKGPEPSP